MIAYKYKALDLAGAHCKGMIRALDEQDAYRRVVASGMTPLSVAEVKETGPAFSFQQVKTADIVALTRELSVLVEARVPWTAGWCPSPRARESLR